MISGMNIDQLCIKKKCTGSIKLNQSGLLMVTIILIFFTNLVLLEEGRTGLMLCKMMMGIGFMMNTDLQIWWLISTINCMLLMR